MFKMTEGLKLQLRERFEPRVIPIALSRVPSISRNQGEMNLFDQLICQAS